MCQPEKHRTERDPPQGALESAESYVAASPGTGTPGYGGGSEFSASFKALLKWGEINDLIRLPDQFQFLLSPTDGHGYEHEAWFDEELNRWFKTTYPNRFGLSWSGETTATAREYLTRLRLQNEFFGDDIRLVALLNCAGKLRVLTSQPNIVGEPAKYSEIQEWFQSEGYVRIESGQNIAWYLEPSNLLVADAHEGNLIRTNSGRLVPIDLNILQPSGEMLQWAVEQWNKFVMRSELPNAEK